MKHRCPICNNIVKASLKDKSEEAKFFPFCSQRCKYIDLGSWLNSEYIIPTDKSQESEGPAGATSTHPDMK